MIEQPVIRVMLVDDHAVVRRGLAAFLMTHRDIQLVGEAANGEEAIRLYTQARPDVILMDLQMPQMDGLTATRLLQAQHPEARILILTSFNEDKLVQSALEAGAIGYLLKDIGNDELAAAIRAVYQGQPVLAPGATRVLIEATSRRQTPRIGHDLSEREREVLNLIARGFDNQRIADSLIVSQATVKFHVSNILSKLHAVSRTEAVAIALEHNIITRHARSKKQFNVVYH